MVAFAKFTKATPPPSHLSHVEHYSHVTVVCGTPFHRPVMSTDTTKFRSKLAKLDKSLDELESQLEPLFAQSLPESLLALDTIQQAKLQVIIPYVVYDLVFGKRARGVLDRTDPGADVLFFSLAVYLKSRGIDPKTHRVIGELVRVLSGASLTQIDKRISRNAFVNTLTRSNMQKNPIKRV